jgi:hypothetical protein
MPKSNRNGVSDTNPESFTVVRADGEVAEVQTPNEPTVTRIDEIKPETDPVIDEDPPAQKPGDGHVTDKKSDDVPRRPVKRASR